MSLLVKIKELTRTYELDIEDRKVFPAWLLDNITLPRAAGRLYQVQSVGKSKMLPTKLKAIVLETINKWHPAVDWF